LHWSIGRVFGFNPRDGEGILTPNGETLTSYLDVVGFNPRDGEGILTPARAGRRRYHDEMFQSP